HGHFISKDLEAIFLTKPQNIIYILGFKIESDTFIILPRDDINDGMIMVFVNALEYDQVKKIIEQDKDFSKIVDLILIPGGKPKFIQKKVNKLGFSNVGFEEDFISVKKFGEWKEKFTIPNFVGTSNIILDARLTKTRDEIERMQKAANLGDIGFKTIFETIKSGITEEELAAEAEYEMRKAGSEGTSFDTIVASGENSAFPHAKTSDKKIEDGDIIIVDIGARYNGYCSDMTRTFIFGKADERKAKLVNLVNDGQKYALENIKADLSCMEMDKLVRDYFIEKNKEWGKRFIHSLGHGVGIDIHENPYLSPISEETLKENMMVTVEPGLYIPSLGGARTEDQVVIKKEGYLLLTHSKKYYYDA
ncbi:MAG: M24 family metallopeptidase, partial [Promethearchaeota archaeon]